MDEYTTRDILALRRPHPTETRLPPPEHEAVIRRLGNRWTITGVSLLTVGIIGTLTLAVLNPHFLDTSTSIMFLHLTGMLVVAAGASLLTAGLIERILQPQRTLVRQAMARLNRNSDLLERSAAVTDRIVARLEAIERVVRDLPDYGRGVIDGVQMRTDALDDRE